MMAEYKPVESSQELTTLLFMDGNNVLNEAVEYDGNQNQPILNVNELESCLICSRTAKTNHFSTFPLLPGCKDSQILNQQMWSVFILRKLLRYPQTKFSLLMKETFGVLNPGSWFDLCDACAEIVQSAMAVYSEILRFTSELGRLKTKLGAVMDISFKAEVVKRESDEFLENVISPRKRIREYFKESLIKPAPLVPKVETPQADSYEYQHQLQMLESYDEFEEPLLNQVNQLIESRGTSEEEDELQDKSDPLYVPDLSHHVTGQRSNKKRSRKSKMEHRMVDDDLELSFNAFDSVEVGLDPLQAKINGEKAQRSATRQNKLRIEQNRRKQLQSISDQSDVEQFIPENESESDPEWIPDDTGESKPNRSKSFLQPTVSNDGTNNAEMCCHLCPIKYVNLRSLQQHLTNHERCKTFSCPFCNFPCGDGEALHVHSKKCLKAPSSLNMQESSEINEKEMITDRSSNFSSRLSEEPDHEQTASNTLLKRGNKKLQTPVKTNKKPIPLQCKICLRKCTNSDSFKMHMDKHEQNVEFACEKCKYPCSNAQALAVHLKYSCEQANRRDYIHKCKFCDYMSKLKYKITSHMRRKHGANTKPSSSIPGRAKDKVSDSIGPDKANSKLEFFSVSTERFKKDGKYHCPLCPATHTCRTSFVRHRRDHQRKKYTFKCKLCPFPAPTYSRLLLHMRKIHSNSNIPEGKNNASRDEKSMEDEPTETKSDSAVTSAVEDGGFENPEWMAEDKLSSSSSESSEDEHDPRKGLDITCGLCGRKFTNANYFSRHEKLHETCKEFACSKCNYPCTSQSALDRHVKYDLCKKECSWKVQGKKFKCDTCEYVTNRRYKFEAHVSVHKAKQLSLSSKKVEQKISLSCKICDRTFNSEKTLEMHVANHELYKEFTCPKCKYPCSNAKALKCHQTKNRCEITTSDNFQCALCPYSTIYRTVFDKHMKNHRLYDGTETSDGQRKCNLCQETFAGKRQLAVHQRKVHGPEIGLETFQCPDCPKSYGRKAALEDHVSQVHQKNCKYYCEFCGYGTNNANTLERHAAKHKQEKPFVCEHCGISYKFPNGLQLHLIKNHSEKATMKSYKCKYCDSDFNNKALLNLHLKDAHSDMFIHKCDECENSYMSVASLQLHKKINHTSKSAECEFCKTKVANAVYLYSHYKFCKNKPPGFKYTVPRGKSNMSNETN